ncbi:MAG TPA: acyl-CoA thioesterase, partial [Phycisphaerales bacterium]|nr:acyl-CoA thioesterase [Phycisphaerales bacterium]
HVNNVVYFRYFESARIDYFKEIADGEFFSSGFKPILAKTECSYLRPVVFPDTLEIDSAVSRLGSSSLTMSYRVVSRRQGDVVAEGAAVVVNVDPETGKSRPLPAEMRARIEKLQAD